MLFNLYHSTQSGDRSSPMTRKTLNFNMENSQNAKFPSHSSLSWKETFYQLTDSEVFHNHFPWEGKRRKRKETLIWWRYIPVYPELHWQVLLPIVSVQFAFELHPPSLVIHSSMFSQYVPFPVYPILHVHVLEPRVFEHIALISQPPLDLKHSSMSKHCMPLPSYPV